MRVLMAVGLVLAAGLGAAEPLRVVSFQPAQPLCRAERPADIVAVLENPAEEPVEAEAQLMLPAGVENIGPDLLQPIRIEGGKRAEVRWSVRTRASYPLELRLRVRSGSASVTQAHLPMTFLPPVAVEPSPYIPEPVPLKTDILVGAHNCPLWEADRHELWAQVLKHPERTPALGFYSQESPEVADWETKWAVEHGVNFFVYCWYRASQGEPVKMNFDSAIHDAFFKSRFVDKMKFTIMWENQSRGRAGVADERDLMENLLPFWMENYFKHPSYLKIDNKPLLFVYRPEFLVDDLGGVDKVVAAFERMREACRAAGFDGLYILGEYRGLDPEHLKLLKSLGLDYTFAYCWHVQNDPTPEQAIAAQIDSIRKTQELGILPQVVTVSQAWSGWRDEGSIWKLPPTQFEALLREAKKVISTFPAQELGSKMLLLDNWNEWSEGHYLAPYREYGFGYLDAVRAVFGEGYAPHVDLLPEDLGMGPYDTAYRAHAQQQEELRRQVSTRATKSGSDFPGLIAWWAFDEGVDEPVALDYSGHRLGGVVRDAQRAPGLDGNALVCEGGTVEVPGNALLSPEKGLTIECWVRTDAAGQDNTWIVNRVFGESTSSGYRLGVLDGKPCFEVPFTDWSHHLQANAALPTGRWVHLAGTFDGQTMRVYVDGLEQGAMERPGPVHANAARLCIGNYDVGHGSHFVGLVDELRLYDRALSAEEIAERHRALATP